MSRKVVGRTGVFLGPRVLGDVGKRVTGVNERRAPLSSKALSFLVSSFSPEEDLRGGPPMEKVA